LLKQLGKYYYRRRGHYPVSINGRKFKGDPYHIGFWRIMNNGGFEPKYFKMLEQYLCSDSVYCDIGSWIGPTVMYAARFCKHVYAFEPDPVAYPFLLQNVQLNELTNVSSHNIAIAAETGTVKIASHGGNLGDSMTSMVNIPNGAESFTVPSFTWQSWLDKEMPGNIEFIKLDIEGGEIEVVPSMIYYLKRKKPVLHLSVHGPYLNEKHKRKELNRLFWSLEFYDKCFDENLNRIELDTKLIESCMDSFRSFLFTI